METMLQDGYHDAAPLETTCPMPECQRIITEVQIQEVAPDLVTNFEKWQLESFLGANRGTLRWCPGADCEWIAMKAREGLFEDHSNGFMCSNCQTAFCFRCGREPHPVGGGLLYRPEVIIVEEELVE
jgi:hypothetical protein